MDPKGARAKRSSAVVVAAVALLCGGCADDATQGPSTVQPSGPTAARTGPLGAPTAAGVIDELARKGFETVNPVDTTRQECPAAGCDQSVVTDRFRVKSFSSTGKAQTYAADHNMRQVGPLVVSFAESVPQSEQERYWAAIVSLVR